MITAALATAWLPLSVGAAPPEPDPRFAEQPSPEALSDEPTPASAPKTKTKSKDTAEPKWIKHRIIPGERIGDIADRYEVRTASLIRWNKLDEKNPKIFAGRELAVYTAHAPPPRRKISYTVVFGDTWNKIAEAHRVDPDQLRLRWNPKVPRRFKAGQELVIWVEQRDDAAGSGTAATAKTADGPGSKAVAPLPLVKIPGSSISVGKPNDGKLVSSVQLPENNKLYTIRKPDESYGSSHTLDNLQVAIATWRRDTGYGGKLKIGAISKRGGGKLKPHSSHRSGRDVDIRLPLKSSGGSADKVGDVDWDAVWGLVTALVATGEVKTIYLTTDRQKHLLAAAKRAGASKATIEQMLQYPETRGHNNGFVRHQKGHTAHIHVRFSCAPNETRCEDY